MSKIAIPTRNGLVDEHFGHCESFTVFEVDADRRIQGQENFIPPPACGCKSNLVFTLKDMGVQVLLGGNMGQGAVTKLKGQGIDVVRGASGPVTEVVRAWLDGRLKDNGELCATHHDHDCSHESGPFGLQ